MAKVYALNVRNKMRVNIRRILRKHGFPPDLQADAITAS
ncbi:type I restriction enzyme endonuclease domain-containing protein [Rhodovulum steppense]